MWLLLSLSLRGLLGSLASLLRQFWLSNSSSHGNSDVWRLLLLRNWRWPPDWSSFGLLFGLYFLFLNLSHIIALLFRLDEVLLSMASTLSSVPCANVSRYLPPALAIQVESFHKELVLFLSPPIWGSSATSVHFNWFREHLEWRRLILSLYLYFLKSLSLVKRLLIRFNFGLIMWLVLWLILLDLRVSYLSFAFTDVRGQLLDDCLLLSSVPCQSADMLVETFILHLLLSHWLHLLYHGLFLYRSDNFRKSRLGFICLFLGWILTKLDFLSLLCFCFLILWSSG